ncbi:hypothetical protein [Streptomyces humi]|uniref:hypothetical protein n=1 Tax=Streptomyces humi TaxID=1428620 RepID=UPI00142D4235|nr:hypothetical protein [Streptomyces humi]
MPDVPHIVGDVMTVPAVGVGRDADPDERDVVDRAAEHDAPVPHGHVDGAERLVGR